MWDAGSARLPLELPCALSLGRGDDVDVKVPSASVSRRHAELSAKGPDHIRITDLGSANGSFLGTDRLPPGTPRALPLNTPVRIGDAQLVVRPAAADDTTTSEAPSLVASAPAMQKILELVERFAKSDLPILIHGETGTGKEVLAQRIHEVSGRPGPFLAINCGALHKGLLDSELFGHEKGAFTGADQAREGLFVRASGGTLFLDEIAETEPETQVRLLRVLEAKEVRPVGGAAPTPIDVRIVAATHQNLEAAVSAGRFREDLLYRLDGARLSLPPLRDRPDDIEALAAHFLRPTTSISPEAVAQLRQHRWPGNIRELRNVLARAEVLSGGRRIEPAHLPEPVPPTDTAPNGPTMDLGAGADVTGVREQMKALERARILKVLEAHGGNQTQAAKALGISRKTLLRRLDDYGVPRPRKGKEGA